MQTSIFNTVPSDNHLKFFQDGEFQPKRVVDYLSLSHRDLSRISGLAESSVRLGERIPGALQERLLEIATVCELVATYFRGDASKTALWFNVPNPLLGDMSPKDMIRYGRYKKLLKYIQNALAGNSP
jgi:hypothetical protein